MSNFYFILFYFFRQTFKKMPQLALFPLQFRAQAATTKKKTHHNATLV